MQNIINYFRFLDQLIRKMSELKALSEGFHIMCTIDNCKSKAEIQKVLDSLTNISLVKVYHATINLNHISCFCLKCRLHDQIQDALLARDSPESRLDYSTNFQKLYDLPPYPFCKTYRENIFKNCKFDW